MNSMSVGQLKSNFPFFNLSPIVEPDNMIIYKKPYKKEAVKDLYSTKLAGLIRTLVGWLFLQSPAPFIFKDLGNNM